MRGESHRQLGRYLAEKYMPCAPKRYVCAFKLGCVQPDHNPASYLKGSLRAQFLRGHNYENARRYMARLADRLENKQRLYLLDYYAVGKLIHYASDAFTFAHNEAFTPSLRKHRAYEKELQEHFLAFLRSNPTPCYAGCSGVMEAVEENHRRYLRRYTGILTDAHYVFTVSCLIAATIL